MALATKCPYCQTAFRVANDQLKLHAGLVRCGSCQQTFNGIEHLLAPSKPPAAVSNPVEAEATIADQAAMAEENASEAQLSTNETNPPSTENDERVHIVEAALNKASKTQAETTPASTPAVNPVVTPVPAPTQAPAPVAAPEATEPEVLEFNLDIDDSGDATVTLEQQIQNLDASVADLTEASAGSGIAGADSVAEPETEHNQDSLSEENQDQEPSLDAQLLAQLPLEQEAWDSDQLDPVLAKTEAKTPGTAENSDDAFSGGSFSNHTFKPYRTRKRF